MAGATDVNLSATVRWLAMRLRLALERLAPPRDAERRRLVSVDAVRALAIAGMLMVNNEAHGVEGELQFHHVGWEGLRFADAVFPAFLFVAGVSLALSYDRRGDQPPLKIWTHLLSRVVALVTIGLVLNYYKYGVPLRYAGVLQRIALASLLAAPLVRKKPVYAVLGAALFLILHTSFLVRAQAPGVVPGSFGGDETSFAFWLDRTAFGIEHMYKQRLDPEGLLGVLSSAGQVMLGIAAGGIMARWPRNWRTPAYLFIAGFALVVAGFALEPYVPIVKKLWTASFVLLTSGLTLMVLMAFYALADLYRFERPVVWLAPLGRNALAVYVGSIAMALWLEGIVLGQLLREPLTAYIVLSDGFVAALGDYWGAIAFSGMFVVIWYAIAAALDRSRIYIKL